MATNNNYEGKSQPVLVLGAIVTGLTVLFGGITLVSGLQDNPTLATAAGIGTLVLAAVNAGKDFYVKSQVVPYVDTAVYVNEEGHTVAGPASPLPNGVQVDPTVDLRRLG